MTIKIDIADVYSTCPETLRIIREGDRIAIDTATNVQYHKTSKTYSAVLRAEIDANFDETCKFVGL
jgi:hypothetical protein